jgi:hypothetical protein
MKDVNRECGTDSANGSGDQAASTFLLALNFQLILSSAEG